MHGSKAREREPCMLCYTSGTTGNPKGVLYEHRSSVIHAMAEVAPSCFDLSPALGGAADRADVPRRRLGPALRRRDGRDQVRLCPGQRSGRAVPADERGEGDPQRRRADRLARHVPAYGRDRREARASADRHHRRLGGAAGDDRAADEDGHPRRPCLGDDRDLADRHDRLAAGQLGRADASTSRSIWSPSRGGCRSGSSCGSSTTTATSSRATARAPAGCRSAAPG